MNKLTMILSLAHSGLSTAVTLLNAAANKAAKEGNADAAKKNRELAKILDAADKGITSYMVDED